MEVAFRGDGDMEMDWETVVIRSDSLVLTVRGVLGGGFFALSVAESRRLLLGLLPRM